MYSFGSNAFSIVWRAPTSSSICTVPLVLPMKMSTSKFMPVLNTWIFSISIPAGRCVSTSRVTTSEISSSSCVPPTSSTNASRNTMTGSLIVSSTMIVVMKKSPV